MEEYEYERRVERLDKYIKFRGMNDNRITHECGLAIGTLAKSRKPGKDITVKTCQAILDTYPEINRSWLLMGEGEMIGALKKIDYASYPLIDTSKAECGQVFGIANTSRISELPFISIPGIPKDTEFFIQASGYSMINNANPELSIPAGALVGLARVKGSILHWGEVYAISTNDGIMIKRIFQGTDGQIRCLSYNAEEYPEFCIDRTDIHDIARLTCVIPINLR